MDMDKRLVSIGIAGTAVYLSFAAWLFWNEFAQVDGANEWGDFLAGAFGPIAVLWLILGFFQQGLELKESRKALLLQADEQRKLVDVSNLQLKAQTEATERATAAAKDAAQPYFVVQKSSYINHAEFQRHRLALINMGASVSNVRFSCSQRIRSLTPSHRSLCFKENGIDLQVDLDSTLPLNLLSIQIRYRDSFGQEGEQLLVLGRSILHEELMQQWRS